MKLTTILEEKGYSKYAEGGETNGLTSETLQDILTKMTEEGDDLEEAADETFSKDDNIVESILNYILKIFPDLESEKARLKGAIRQGYADSI